MVVDEDVILVVGAAGQHGIRCRLWSTGDALSMYMLRVGSALTIDLAFRMFLALPALPEVNGYPSQWMALK